MAISIQVAKRYLNSPLDYPPAVSGEWELKRTLIPAGTKQALITPRTAIMTGVKSQEIAYDRDTWRHELLHNDGRVMSDMPSEMYDFAEPIHRAKPPGPVLIGGLGLGYIATCLALRGVRTTVVELETDVINLVAPYLPISNSHHTAPNVVHADIYKYMRDLALHEQFTYYIFDTWTATGENCYWTEVLPLRLAAIRHGANPKNIWCWQESVMHGQIGGSLLRAVSIAGVDHWWPYQLFLDGLPDFERTLVKTVSVEGRRYDIGVRQKIEEAKQANSSNDWVRRMLWLYVYGLMSTKKLARHWLTLWGDLYEQQLAKLEATRNESDDK